MGGIAASFEARAARRWLPWLVAAWLTAGVAWAAEPVRIAVVGPMAGTSAAVGVQYQAGVAAALEALGGTILGRPVAVRSHDDACEAAIAEAVAQEIVHDPPHVVIGHSCSGATIAAAPVYARHGVLQITPASSNPRVTEMGIATIFRIIGRDDLQGELAAARLAERFPGRRVGIVAFHGVYAEGLAAAAVAGLKRRGMASLVAGGLKPGLGSYADALEGLLAARPEVLYLVGGGQDAGIVVRQLRRLGARMPILGSDTMLTAAFLDTAGEAAEGVVFTAPPRAAELPSAARAVAAIRARGQDPEGYALLAYAAVEAWAEGVRRAGSFEAAAVAQAMRQAPMATALGEVSFDAKGDMQAPYPSFSWYQWRHGERVPAP